MSDERMELSTTEYSACETQAELFEYIAEEGYDFEWFVEQYMDCKWCNREMDSKYSAYHTSFPEEQLEFITPQIGELKKYPVGKFFHSDVAYWIGFTYRQMAIQTQIHSSELIRLLSLATMCNYYPGLHTVDDEMATDIICENFKLEKVVRDL